MNKKWICSAAVGIALVTSCGPKETAPTEFGIGGKVLEGVYQTSTAGQITLTTKPWSAGAGSLKVVTSSLMPTESTANLIATTPLNTDGTFNLTPLPQPAAGDLKTFVVLATDTCTGAITPSDTALKLTYAEVTVVPTAQPTVTYTVNPVKVAEDGKSITRWRLVYADRASTIAGQISCTIPAPSPAPAGSIKTNMNLTLKAGWNVFTMTVSGDDSNTVVDFKSSDSLPSEWVTGSASGGSS